jgi:site-specific recombinase XerD
MLTLRTPDQGIPEYFNELTVRGLAEGTIKLYLSTVKRFLHHYPLPTSADLRTYLTRRLQQVSPTKVRNDQKALRSFFNFLEEQSLWLNNPTKGMKLIKVNRVIRQAPEKEHVDILLSAWKDSPQRIKHRLFILLFVDTGIRIKEACSLEVKNIYLDRAEIKVAGKGGKERIVPLSPVTVDLMREYLHRCPHNRYLFPAKSVQGYQSIHNLERTFRRLCDRLGIPRISPHKLRHYFATYALRNGAKLEVISKILGHSSVAITADVYRTVKQDEIREEHQRYSPLSNG